MRFSTSAALLALPLLAAAESPFEQYKAQFQNFLGSFGAKPAAAAAKEVVKDAAGAAAGAATDAAAAAAYAATGTHPVQAVEVLTLGNWKDTLYSNVQSGQTTPDEWWVLVTGRNKTCFGHCGRVESAFNESAALFAKQDKQPHLALLNCDDQPVLCNAWSASTASLWAFQMLPQPAEIDIWRRRMNITTTTAQDYVDIYNAERPEKFQLYHDGWFHPIDGPLAKYNVAVPIGYFFWVFNVIPSWAMMIGVSFLSRRMMNRQMGGNNDPARAAAAPAARPRGAAPGDARS